MYHSSKKRFSLRLTLGLIAHLVYPTKPDGVLLAWPVIPEENKILVLLNCHMFNIKLNMDFLVYMLNSIYLGNVGIWFHSYFEISNRM